MTATQIFMWFLKEELTFEEYQFFMFYLHNHGNKFFKNHKFKRKLLHNTFVEDYLSRNNRPLYGFIKRLFILAPNLKHFSYNNNRRILLVEEWNKTHDLSKKYTDNIGIIRQNKFNPRCLNGMYINYYNKKWHSFLDKWIDKDNSPSVKEWFKKDKKLEFKLKTVIEVLCQEN